MFRIDQTDRLQTMATQREFFSSVLLRGDGTNRLVAHLRTRGEYGDQTARLAFAVRLSTGDPTYPFTITRRGLPELALTLSAPVTQFGSTVNVYAPLPFTPGADAIDQGVTYSVKPAGAGNFRRPNIPSSLAPTLTEQLDDDLNPRRALAIFVPAATDKIIDAKIMATLMGRTMGRTKTMPITIRRVPTPCTPLPEWTSVRARLC